MGEGIASSTNETMEKKALLEGWFKKQIHVFKGASDTKTHAQWCIKNMRQDFTVVSVQSVLPCCEKAAPLPRLHCACATPCDV